MRVFQTQRIPLSQLLFFDTCSAFVASPNQSQKQTLEGHLWQLYLVKLSLQHSLLQLGEPHQRRQRFPLGKHFHSSMFRSPAVPSAGARRRLIDGSDSSCWWGDLIGSISAASPPEIDSAIRSKLSARILGISFIILLLGGTDS